MKQFKVRVKNEAGALADVCEALAGKNVSIRAISTEAKEENCGFIKVIPNSDIEARKALNFKGFTYTESEVIVVDVLDAPDTVAKLTRKMADSEINIKSFYLLDKGLFAMTVPTKDFLKAKETLGERVIDN